MCSGEPTGHALTMQAALLSQAPNLESDHSWEIPAVELDRLLNLSFNLDLDGEVTPVQAWNRIRSHPGFRKLTPSALQSLSQAIAEKVACFGYVHMILCGCYPCYRHAFRITRTQKRKGEGKKQLTLPIDSARLSKRIS